ncbi:MAG: M6 family metalloprotease domain-containing protein [bacterium]
MKNLKKNVLSCIGVLICAVSFVQAAPFAKTIQFRQPDGTAIELWGEGDDFHAVFETLDGYTVTFDPALKTYFYATVSADGTQLVATDLEVGKGTPMARGLAQHVRISAEALSQQAKARFEKWDSVMEVTKAWTHLKNARRSAETVLADGPVMAPPRFTTVGQKMGLCLLIDFPDDRATVPQSNVEQFCNGDAYAGFGNNGSVKKYFQDNSNNLLVYSNAVTAYIRMVKSKSYYNDTSKDCGAQARLLINDAVAIMKALPNYVSDILPMFSDITVNGASEIVACNVFYTGGNGGSWTYGLWPHSWTLASPLELSAGGKKVFKYQVTNIGSRLSIATFCHENGHMLCGFPDIYDYDYDSTGGAGSFCLMDYGGPDNNPVQVSAYLKRAAGWCTTIEATYQSGVTGSLVATPGIEGFNRIIRYAKPEVATEYFLFENRQKTGRDASLPAAGIAIWHIDELGDRDNQSLAYNTTHANYECTLEQADNQWHFQSGANSGDPYDLYYLGNTTPAYTGVFSDSSAPSARWWDGTASLMEAHDFSVIGETMTFTIAPRPPTMLTIGTLPSGRVGTPYSYPLTAVGGATPYTWSIDKGTLPLGITFSTNGLISGMPEEAVTSNFSVVVMGASGVGATNDFSLTIRPVFLAPFTETFEYGGSLPDGWMQEYVTNTVPWVYENGGVLGHPASAHGGSYNASLSVTSTNRAVTRLVSPRIDFGPSPRAAQLTFWHFMEAYVGDQDQLRIYYKTTFDAPWTLIQSYTTSISQWRKQTVTLPEPGRTYYIAFEGTARYGYGIYIDDVYVCDPTPPLGIITPSPLPNAIINVGYTQILETVSGTLPYTYAQTSGALPAGITLSTNGVISGSAPVAGTFLFDVTVTDATGNSSTTSFELSVTEPVIVMFSEPFENGGQLQAFEADGKPRWTQEYVTGSASWTCENGGGYWNIARQPASAHGGSYNALLFAKSTSDHKTLLVLNARDLSTAPPTTRLIFWHCMTALDGDQDELRVYYRTSAAAAWTQLAWYKNRQPAWTNIVLALPNPSSTYYVAFEGRAKYGYGVCIDDVSITGDLSPYSAWKSLKFTEEALADGLTTGDNDDPDGDTIVNGLEYAMGLDPKVFDTAGMPYGGVMADYLTLTYRENKFAVGVRFEVEACTSLVENVWSTNGVSEILRANSNLWWNVTTRHNVPVTDVPQRFMRLKVYLP